MIEKLASLSFMAIKSHQNFMPRRSTVIVKHLHLISSENILHTNSQ
jgi:hypothetical protein